MATQSQFRAALCAAGIGLTVSGSPATAATVSGLSSANTSAGTSHTGSTGLSRSYDSLNTQVQPAITTNGVTTFSYHHQWTNAIHVDQPAGPSFALTNNKATGYTLSFTVEDPASTGYSIDVDAILRGDLFADWDTPQSGSPSVTASGGIMSATFDNDTTDPVVAQSVTDLFLNAGSTNATQTDPSSMMAIDLQASHNLGTFYGTRSFALAFTTFGSSTSVFMGNHGAGEASARFGLDAQHSGNLGSPLFDHAVYDVNETPSLDGHFVDVTITSIPEPSSGLALLVLASLSTRRRARTS